MSIPKTNECTGECCTSFTLTYGYKKRWRFNEDNKVMASIAEMLVWTGRRLKSSDIVNMTGETGYKNQAEYTCKHHDGATGLCIIYEERPAMCSEFPYSGLCGVCGMIGPTFDPKSPGTSWCCQTHWYQYLRIATDLETKSEYRTEESPDWRLHRAV